MLLHYTCMYVIYIWVFPNMGKISPNHPLKKRVSTIIITIHFGVYPYLLETPWYIWQSDICFCCNPLIIISSQKRHRQLPAANSPCRVMRSSDSSSSFLSQRGEWCAYPRKPIWKPLWTWFFYQTRKKSPKPNHSFLGAFLFMEICGIGSCVPQISASPLRILLRSPRFEWKAKKWVRFGHHQLLRAPSNWDFL